MFSKFKKALLTLAVVDMAINGIAIGVTLGIIVGFAVAGPAFPLIAAGTIATGAAALGVNAAIRKSAIKREEKEHPTYNYQAPDGSIISVQPSRQQVTRRLSESFARAADFDKKVIGDLIQVRRHTNPAMETVHKIARKMLTMQFNRHGKANIKTFEQNREYDEGAIELFVMEKYLQHATAQYKEDLATGAAGTKPQKQDGTANGASATRKQKQPVL